MPIQTNLPLQRMPPLRFYASEADLGEDDVLLEVLGNVLCETLGFKPDA